MDRVACRSCGSSKRGTAPRKPTANKATAPAIKLTPPAQHRAATQGTAPTLPTKAPWQAAKEAATEAAAL
eukprot:12921946-Prorocentrum_lima.AAC.1